MREYTKTEKNKEKIEVRTWKDVVKDVFFSLLGIFCIVVLFYVVVLIHEQTTTKSIHINEKTFVHDVEKYSGCY